MSRPKMSSKYARIASRPSTRRGSLGVFCGVGDLDRRVVGVQRRQGGGVAVGEGAPQRGAVQRGVGVDGGHGRTVAAGRHRPVKPSVKAGIGLPPMLRVRLLGELQAEVDGAPVAMPAARRAWALLGWLALHPGEHARGAVAARFWPDVLDSSARASLRSALWELRRALGGDDCAGRGSRPHRAALRDRPGGSSTRTSPPGGSRPRSPCTAGRCSPTSTTTGCSRRATSTPSGSARRSRGSRRPPPPRPTPSAGRAAGSRSTRSTRTPRAS